MNEPKEKEIRQKRRSSTPVPSTFITRPTPLQRRLSFKERSEVAWETLSSVSYRNRQQELAKSTDKSNLSNSSIPRAEMVKLPQINCPQKQNCQDLGHKKLDAFGKMKLTGRRPSLPDNFCFTKPNLTSQRQRIIADEEPSSLSRQFLWSTNRQAQSNALQEFITNANAHYDSNKEKAMILCNWMSSQTSPRKA